MVHNTVYAIPKCTGMPSVTVSSVTVTAEYDMRTQTMADMIEPAWSEELNQIPFCDNRIENRERVRYARHDKTNGSREAGVQATSSAGTPLNPSLYPTSTYDQTKYEQDSRATLSRLYEIDAQTKTATRVVTEYNHHQLTISYSQSQSLCCPIRQNNNLLTFSAVPKVQDQG